MREFAQDLARELGQVSWRAMYASVSAQTIIEWEQYFSKHDFTHRNADKRHGIMCASIIDAIFASHGVKLEQPCIPSHFYPNPIIDIYEPTEEELMAAGQSAGGMRFECSDS
jgi:hypothetical protein